MTTAASCGSAAAASWVDALSHYQAAHWCGMIQLYDPKVSGDPALLEAPLLRLSAKLKTAMQRVAEERERVVASRRDEHPKQFGVGCLCNKRSEAKERGGRAGHGTSSAGNRSPIIVREEVSARRADFKMVLY